MRLFLAIPVSPPTARKSFPQQKLISMVEEARSLNNRYAGSHLEAAEERFFQKEIPEISRELENLTQIALKAPLTDEYAKTWVQSAGNQSDRLADCGMRLRIPSDLTRAELLKKIEGEYAGRVPLSVAKLKAILGPPDGIAKSGSWCQVWTYLCDDGEVRFEIKSIGGALGGVNLDDDAATTWLEPEKVNMF